jgi:hypothetical protein
VAPGNNITGGKRGSGKTTQGDVWLIDILTQRACAAAHTHDTYLSAQFWRLARRIGKKKAAVAVAHSILVSCWHLLTDDHDYDDLGGDYFTRRNVDRQRDRLIQQLHGLGYRVTLDKLAQAGGEFSSQQSMVPSRLARHTGGARRSRSGP